MNSPRKKELLKSLTFNSNSFICYVIDFYWKACNYVQVTLQLELCARWSQDKIDILIKVTLI